AHRQNLWKPAQVMPLTPTAPVGPLTPTAQVMPLTPTAQVMPLTPTAQVPPLTPTRSFRRLDIDHGGFWCRRWGRNHTLQVGNQGLALSLGKSITGGGINMPLPPVLLCHFQLQIPKLSLAGFAFDLRLSSLSSFAAFLL